MRTLIQTLFSFLLVTQICFGQLEFFNNEQQQKPSSVQLTDAFNVNLDSLMLDSIILAYQNSLSIPGIATLIIKDNEVVWNKNYGYRNLQYQLPVEDSTIFLIVSISKTILATAVMQLWENGMIDLEKNINNYLPNGFTVANPRFPSDTITVKMLLTHTSSILDNGTIEIPLISCGDSPISLNSFLVNYLTSGGSYYSLNNYGNYRPGEQWNYSNPGAALLALIVENLTGKTFDQYCRDSIFIPLSMNSASWFLAGMDTNQIATPYVGSSPICHQGWPHYPIGFLRTNKIDLAKFLMAYMNNGIYNNVRILHSTTISYMLSDQLSYPAVYLSPWWIWKQGLIWWNVFPINNSALGHAGNWDGYLTYMCYDPSEKWGTIFFQNKHTRSSNSLLSLFGEINSHFTKYAHLYGNIYALAPSVDKSYSKIDVDSILFRTRFSNIYNHQFTPYLIYANLDSTFIDSLTLFDDGLHGDLLPNDEIYGGYIPTIPIEDFFTLSVSALDNQTNKYFNTSDLCRFTTAGPIKVDSATFTHQANWRRYNIKLAVKNLGNSLTVQNVKIKAFSNDPWVLNILNNPVNCPSLPPGQSVISSTAFSIVYDTSTIPANHHFNLKFEMSVDGVIYWKDSLLFEPILVGVDDPVDIPKEFALEQNFPNPFNPSTTISWQSPVGNWQTLKIYDVLGNDITTLVNEYKPAGRYEVDFNAGYLPSGVYFYKLQAGNYMETKKMILMK